MYTKHRTGPDLKAIVAKIQGKRTAPPARVVYSSADIVAAKTVLTRLLDAADRNEVSYTKVAAKEVSEI